MTTLRNTPVLDRSSKLGSGPPRRPPKKRRLARCTLPLRRFVVRSPGNVVFVAAENVEWIAASRGGVTLHAGGHSYQLRSCLREIESRLERPTFLRIHRSIVINVGALRALESNARGDLVAVLRDDTRLAIGRSRHNSIRQALLP